MSIVVYLGDPDETRDWVTMLSRLLPEFEVRDFDDPGDAALVEYAVVWAPPAGGIARFPSIRAVISIGAGIDHVLRDPKYPRHVPIIRTTGPDMEQRMREYVALHVLAHHRALMTTDANAASARWTQIVTPVAGRRRVGVMGLGSIAQASIRTLADLGFDVAAWSRSGRPMEGIAVFSGASGLAEFLARTEILVCLLPLTEETSGILGKELFDALPEGGSVINVGRGKHLVEQDLLDALDSGKLGFATLDVFQTEPLPPDHAFWTHPKIRVTPHIASMIDADTGAAIIAENIRAFDSTGTCAAIADAQRGY